MPTTQEIFDTFVEANTGEHESIQTADELLFSTGASVDLGEMPVMKPAHAFGPLERLKRIERYWRIRVETATDHFNEYKESAIRRGGGDPQHLRKLRKTARTCQSHHADAREAVAKASGAFRTPSQIREQRRIDARQAEREAALLDEIKSIEI